MAEKLTNHVGASNSHESISLTSAPFAPNTATDASEDTTHNQNEKLVKCAPETGNWAGGDKIFMMLHKLDTKKSISILSFFHANFVLFKLKDFKYTLISGK